MRIGILGTRGIPNHYGGFEQLAQYLGEGLVKKGHEVWVYNSSAHPYKKANWNGVKLIHCYDPEKQLGTAGQFIYDLNCVTDSRSRNFDIILQLGYTSSSIWFGLHPAGSSLLVNMDGMEWQRSKYAPLVQRFLQYAEKRAARSADMLIADSTAIKAYLLKKYKIDATYIAYGATPFENPDAAIPLSFDLKPSSYDLLIARFEPENNIEAIISGYIQSKKGSPLLMIGNHHNKFGSRLKKKYADQQGLLFMDPVYDLNILNSLRHYCRIYFHGHSAGGTNPSLLEAMACSALVCAHANEFNRAVLGSNAFYFESAHDIRKLLDDDTSGAHKNAWRQKNLEKIRTEYSWDRIIGQYEELMRSAISR